MKSSTLNRAWLSITFQWCCLLYFQPSLQRTPLRPRFGVRQIFSSRCFSFFFLLLLFLFLEELLFCTISSLLYVIIDCNRDSTSKTSPWRHRSETQRYYQLREKYSGAALQINRFLACFSGYYIEQQNMTANNF